MNNDTDPLTLKILSFKSKANLPDYNFMGKGWSILERKIDDYDVEWQVWKGYISNFWYCFVIHVVSAELYRYLKLKVSFKNSSG